MMIRKILFYSLLCIIKLLNDAAGKLIEIAEAIQNGR